MKPPSALAAPNGGRMGRTCASSDRYAAADATDAGQRTTALVAFAVMGSTPATTSAGNVRKLPPPATELSAPPRLAATARSKPWSKGIGFGAGSRTHALPAQRCKMPALGRSDARTPRVLRGALDRGRGGRRHGLLAPGRGDVFVLRLHLFRADHGIDRGLQRAAADGAASAGRGSS